MWLLELPWQSPPVKANGPRGNHYAHAAHVRAVRRAVGVLARNAKIPHLGRCRVELTWYVPDRIRRDVDNLMPMMKPVYDALSSGRQPFDWPIVEDDTPQFMVKTMPEIVFVKGCRKRFELVIVGA